MRWLHVLWDADDDPEGNIQHITDNFLTKEDVEWVLEHPVLCRGMIGMAKLKRIIRDRHLTSAEAAADKAVREQVMEEFPPIRAPLMRRAARLLREQRERQQLTQTEAAKKAGLSREVIARLETQPGNATINTLERYARGLGFDFEITLAPAAPAQAKRNARKRPA